MAELYGQARVVTYNRMLRRSLQLVADANDINIRASTMQSFVWNDFRRRTGAPAPTLPQDRYAYQWQSMIQHLADRQPDAGALVVDEGQDLPPGFFVYASRFVAKALSVFADEEQAVSGRGSTLEEMRDAAGLPDPSILSENHRNTPEIAHLAEHFHHGRLPAASVARPSSGDLPVLFRSMSDKATATRIANELRNRAGSIGVIVSQNATGDSVCELLSDQLEHQRVDKYSNKLQNEDEIDVRARGLRY